MLIIIDVTLPLRVSVAECYQANGVTLQGGEGSNGVIATLSDDVVENVIRIDAWGKYCIAPIDKISLE